MAKYPAGKGKTTKEDMPKIQILILRNTLIQGSKFVPTTKPDSLLLSLLNSGFVVLQGKWTFLEPCILMEHNIGQTSCGQQPRLTYDGTLH